MRRYLLIFLLMLFPLQVSWAAVCAYCQEECVVERSSGEQTVTTQLVAQDDVKASNLATADSDCECCHSCSTGMMGASFAPLTIVVAQPSEQIAGSNTLAASRSVRPERPKWTRAA
jgi:hypothetical protein